MSISKRDIKRFKKMTRVFGAVFTDITVTLVDDRTEHSVRGHIGIRASGSPLTNSAATPLTGGSDQDKMVGVVLPDSWDAAIPRPPKKGDVLEKGGLKYAVQRIILASPGGVDMMYKMELRG